MASSAKTCLRVATVLSFTLAGLSGFAQGKALAIWGSVKVVVSGAVLSSSVLFDVMIGELERVFNSLGKFGFNQKDVDK